VKRIIRGAAYSLFRDKFTVNIGLLTGFGNKLKKYRLSVTSPPVVTLEGLVTLLLLFILSLAALIYHLVRIQYYEPIDFSLDWNLFLSWIPLLLAYAGRLYSRKYPSGAFLTVAISIVWLLFFPNAPYMITDLIHLSVDYNRTITWHDTIMLFYYAEVSLINGLVSMYWMHRTWLQVFGKRTGHSLLLLSLPFAGLGIYLGRIGRWNSWDILRSPLRLGQAVLESLTDRTALVLSLEFALLLGMLYLLLWVLLRLRFRIHSHD